MYITINNINIYYEKYGTKKQTILILPGWGNNRCTFDYLINFLQDYFTIYILDYPGFGNSTFPNKDLNIYDYTELIYKFITKLNIENPILIGHSFGGRIISILTTKNIKIKKLLLIDIAGLKKKRNIKLLIKQTTYKLLKKLKIFLPNKLKKKYLNYLFNKFSSSDYKTLDKKMLKTFQNIVQEDLTNYIKQIKLETLILWGEYDDITPISNGIKINKLIKNSSLIPISNTKHFPYLEKKYLVSRIIFEYLKKDII
ncbi:MAG: alpha/beta hydrolase [Bacilli bacterium]|nr:alpha/beta hydrolase [Bacilli bacterium]